MSSLDPGGPAARQREEEVTSIGYHWTPSPGYRLQQASTPNISREDKSKLLALINLRSAGWQERVEPNDETADITVLCGETNFKLHSELMCKKSNFFKVALDIPMTEKKEKRVEIRDVEIEIFQKVIEFLYKDNLEFEIESELAGLLDAADRFDIEELKDQISGNVSKILEENEIEDYKWETLSTSSADISVNKENEEEEGGEKSKDTANGTSQLDILEVAHLDRGLVLQVNRLGNLIFFRF